MNSHTHIWSLYSYQNEHCSTDCGLLGFDAVLFHSDGHQQAAFIFRSRARLCGEADHVCISRNGEDVKNWLCYVSDMFVK